MRMDGGGGEIYVRAYVCVIFSYVGRALTSTVAPFFFF